MALAILLLGCSLPMSGQTFDSLLDFDFANGSYPTAGLVQGFKGNFYGATQAGRPNHFGTLFEITPAGKLTALYSFCSQSNCTDGWKPYAGLMQGTDGNFYGTTIKGGVSNLGTVFVESVGLNPFVRTVPVAGKLGSKVTILGTDLTGAGSVTFSGIAANFSVVSATEIVTSVPTGSSTGMVQVTTPTGTLNSNVAFRVVQVDRVLMAPVIGTMLNMKPAAGCPAFRGFRNVGSHETG